MKRFKFYRQEYKRLLKENGDLWAENKKIKKSYDELKEIFNLLRTINTELIRVFLQGLIHEKVAQDLHFNWKLCLWISLKSNQKDSFKQCVFIKLSCFSFACEIAHTRTIGK